MAQESYLKAAMGLLSFPELCCRYGSTATLLAPPPGWTLDLSPGWLYLLLHLWMDPGTSLFLSMPGTAFEPCCLQLALPAVFRCCGTIPAGEDTASAGVTLNSWLPFP